jgi:hypothetical protein
MPHGLPLVQVALPAKPWWRSRTIWFNALAAMLLAAEASFSLLQPLLPGNVYALLSFCLVVGNALLRLDTNRGVIARGRPAAPGAELPTIDDGPERPAP